MLSDDCDLWNFFEIFKKASCGPSAAKLDQSRVLVTKFHQNRLTLKGRSASQKHTDTHTDRQTRLKIMALQVCNRAKSNKKMKWNKLIWTSATCCKYIRDRNGRELNMQPFWLSWRQSANHYSTTHHHQHHRLCFNSHFFQVNLPSVLRRGPIRFQVRHHTKQPSRVSLFTFILCYFRLTSACLVCSVVLGLVSSVPM